jgi:uncharacterized protein (TIGR00645 family)
MQSAIERLLFATRWLLVPLYLALSLSLFAILAKVGLLLYSFVIQFSSMSDSAVILGVLGLVDLNLTASLIVIVILSGYVNFVAKIDPCKHQDWPQWMARIDFSELKLKLMASIVAISAIKLLEAYMELEHESDRELYWLCGIFFLFVIAALGMAVTEWLGHKIDAAKADPHEEELLSPRRGAGADADGGRP